MLSRSPVVSITFRVLENASPKRAEILSGESIDADCVSEEASFSGHVWTTDPKGKAISPGSSGSPVIDHTGKVIGVAVLTITGQTTQSLNFVIPVEAVKKLRMDFKAGTAGNILASIQKTLPNQPKAEDGAEAAYFNDPDFPVLKIHLLASNWIQCAKLARPLAAKHPESAKAQGILGMALHGLGLNDQAETALQASLAIDPENGIVWNYLGFTQDAQKQTARARESWKRVAGFTPDDPSIWHSLAASYLSAGEYLDAVTSLTNLRKLNRPDFENLISFCRSLRVHPPELQAMLYHFDTMADTEPPKASPVAADPATPTTPERLAVALVSAFLRHGEGPNVQLELADYAATVKPYFDQGQQTRAGILKDLTSYRKEWPRRSLRLIGIESARSDDMNTLEATYRLSYSASDGKRNRAGTLVQGIRYTRTAGDRWLVSGIQTIERVK